MHKKNLAELAKGMAAGEYSSVELTTHFLERIKQYGKRLNGFITLT